MRVIAAALLVGLTLCGCAALGSDAEGGRAQADARRPTQPHVVLIVFDEFGGDILLGPNGKIDAGRYPHFAALARDGTWFRNAHTSLRLDHEGGAADPRRDRARNAHRADRARPPALDLHRARPARLPDRAPRRRPPRSARAATAAPSARRRPAIMPNLKGGRAGALRALHPLDQAEPAADLLDEARAAAARALGLPALGRMTRPPGRRAAAGDADDPGFLRRLSHAITTSSASCFSSASPTGCLGRLSRG